MHRGMAGRRGSIDDRRSAERLIPMFRARLRARPHGSLVLSRTPRRRHHPDARQIRAQDKNRRSLARGRDLGGRKRHGIFIWRDPSLGSLLRARR